MQNASNSTIVTDDSLGSNLPSELEKSTSTLRLTFIVLAAAVAVVGINVLISLTGIVDRIDGGGRIIQEKWKLLDSVDEPTDWLVLGDSSADQGVDPDLLASELGGTALNLATVGNVLAVNDVWMLDKYIEQRGAPKNVVIIHVYDMWRRDAETSAFAHIPTAPELWWSNQPSLSLSYTETAELLAFKYLPTFQAKSLIKKLLDDPGKLNTPPRTIQPNGFSPVIEAKPDRVEADFKVHQGFYSQNRFEIYQINIAALDRLVELAEEHDFNVYISNSPIYDGLRSDPEFNIYFRGVSALLNSLSERSQNIHYVLCDTPGFSKELMTNIDHLTVEGSASFTEQLVEDIENPEVCS